MLSSNRERINTMREISLNIRLDMDGDGGISAYLREYSSRRATLYTAYKELDRWVIREDGVEVAAEPDFPAAQRRLFFTISETYDN